MKNLLFIISAGVITLFANPSTENQSPETPAPVLSAEPFIGEIAMFAGNYAPRGWALCDGQLLPINQYQALFSIVGTMYGGDGRSTFALPDLRGRGPIHGGQGPGLSYRTLGEKGGSETANTFNGNSLQTQRGNGQSIDNMQPYLVVNYIIALQGVYPSRN